MALIITYMSDVGTLLRCCVRGQSTSPSCVLPYSGVNEKAMSTIGPNTEMGKKLYAPQRVEVASELTCPVNRG